MAAGLTDRVYSVEWLSDLVSAKFATPGARGPYRPRNTKQMEVRDAAGKF